MSNKYLLRPDGYVLGEAPGSRIIISGSSDQVVTEFIGVSEPLLRLSNGETTVDLLGPGSGWKLDDPYWNPQIAQYKGGGVRVNSGVAEGQRLVHKQYDNVIETIPLIASSISMNATTRTIREVLQLIRQAADYWTEPYELDDVWMEWRSAAPGCGIGYARIVQAHIPELKNPYGQPFYSCLNDAMMEGLNLIVEREPLWRGVPPGQIVGPLYNLIRNPDFSLWNFGIADSQPDNWSDLETIQITGTNNRQDTANRALDKYSLRVRVSGSTLTGRIKGVTQVVQDIKANTEYTILAWVRSDGVSNGVGRILVTYSSQIELYRDDTRHGWQLYGTKFTTGTSDTVGINCEILTTAANTDGTVYFADLMLIEGDFIEEATNGTLPWIGSSHIVNHWDLPETSIVEVGDINYVDVWDVPGDEDANVRLEIINDTTPASQSNPVELISVMRVGMRRTGDVFDFQGWQDPPGALDTTASGNSRVNSPTLSTTVWTRVATFIIETPSITRDNQGRYRLFVRVYDTRTTGILTLQIRTNYWIGSEFSGVKTLDLVTVPVINNWCVVDLTPNVAINFDTKFQSDVPAAFGFDIEMRRTANTDTGRIDYALLLPTDGGCLIADINPAVANGLALIVDCTTESPFVFGATLDNGWNVVSSVTGVSEVAGFQSYNGALFILASNGIHKYRNNRMTLVFSSITVSAIASFNGRFIYFFGDNTGYISDGDTFPGTSTFTLPVGETLVVGFARLSTLAFGGNLYLAGSSGTGFATMYSWNGTAATATKAVQRADLLEFTAMAAYGNRIYLASRNGTNTVYTYDPNTGSLTAGASFATGYISSFIVFRGKLWATNLTGAIWSFDGSAWTSITPFTVSAWQDMEVIDDTLFVIGSRVISGVDRVFVIKSTDGITWTTDLNTSGTIVTMLQIAKHQGQLFIGIDTNVYSRTINTSQYKVSNYQLSCFRSPPKKRHRFFFNWDRENNVNNVDDAALIGIGFVPHYLSLRGKG